MRITVGVTLVSGPEHKLDRITNQAGYQEFYFIRITNNFYRVRCSAVRLLQVSVRLRIAGLPSSLKVLNYDAQNESRQNRKYW